MQASTGAATSSSEQMRLAASFSATLAKYAVPRSSGIPCHIGVSTKPGETALTLTGPSSTASARASDSSAALAQLAATCPAAGRLANTPETNVIDALAVSGACAATRQAPQNLVSNSRAPASELCSRNFSGFAPPAVSTT